MEALVANCGFVARSFAGDPKQVKELIKAALSYKGTAVLDIISPCVTFNNRDESTMSYSWGKQHEDPLHDVFYIPPREDIRVEYEPDETVEVELHDGSYLILKKLSRDYDPTDRMQAIQLLEEARTKRILVTGLIYIDREKPTLQEIQGLVDEPLSMLPETKVRPSKGTLEKINQGFR
jgi:2-oxoglutarate ferredoxin oxidoreductase subunit beta